MTRLSTRLLGAAALVALAAPVFAQETPTAATLAAKIAQARTEPGVAENGTAELDRAAAAVRLLDKKLAGGKEKQAADVSRQVDALIQTARTRAKIVLTKKEVEDLKTANADAQKAQLADAQANAAAANQRADSANAEADRLRAQMADYKMQQTQLGATLVLQDVVFQTAKADLKPGAAERLRPLANYLQANKEVRVRIDGHTDSQGSDAYNQDLSNRRANAIKTALGGMGVDPARIEAVGHGETTPIAGNDTAAGRQQNRRVEVTLVGQQANAFAAVR